jgi:hypothetical protein
MQIRIGQAGTWFPTPDDILHVAPDGGANGETNPEAVHPRVPPVDSRTIWLRRSRLFTAHAVHVGRGSRAGLTGWYSVGENERQ